MTERELFACQQCGAVLHNPARHNKWHDDQKAAIKALFDAARVR